MTLSVQPQTHREYGVVVEDDGLLVGLTDDSDLIQQARRLTASRYLAEGYVEADQISSDGTLDLSVDPYVHHSTYFVAVDPNAGEVVATIRQIDLDEAKGWESFPMLADFEVSHAFEDRLRASEPSKWVELSALAKGNGVPDDVVNRLYREMWGRSFRRSHDHWLIAADRRLARRLRSIFRESVREAGPAQPYMGSETLPLYMPTTAGLDAVCRRYFASSSQRVRERCRVTAQFFVRGIDPRSFTPEQVADFVEMGVDFTVDITDAQPESAL